MTMYCATRSDEKQWREGWMAVLQSAGRTSMTIVPASLGTRLEWPYREQHFERFASRSGGNSGRVEHASHEPATAPPTMKYRPPARRLNRAHGWLLWSMFWSQQLGRKCVWVRHDSEGRCACITATTNCRGLYNHSRRPDQRVLPALLLVHMSHVVRRHERLTPRGVSSISHPVATIHFAAHGGPVRPEYTPRARWNWFSGDPRNIHASCDAATPAPSRVDPRVTSPKYQDGYLQIAESLTCSFWQARRAPVNVVVGVPVLRLWTRRGDAALRSGDAATVGAIVT